MPDAFDKCRSAMLLPIIVNHRHWWPRKKNCFYEEKEKKSHVPIEKHNVHTAKFDQFIFMLFF